MSTTRILVVDDEPQILRTLSLNLRVRHYEVQTATDGAHALIQAAAWHPDLVILDLGLPDLDGVEVIERLRHWNQVPIIVLSGRTDSEDKVLALDAGADDYVIKPFGVDELLARIRAVSRREIADEPPIVHIGALKVDLARKSITTPNESPVHLTPTEWGILELLLRNPRKLISQRHILARVWGPTHVGETHYLRIYLSALRRKLEPDPSRPRHLITESGMGYRFEP